jgi:peptidyl-prolyl cis-trans isomerase C
MEPMLRFTRTIGTALSLALFSLPATAQIDPKTVPVEKLGEKPEVAATVNGQPIHETAIERALQGIAADERAKVRSEVINFIVENTIIDQYLIALKMTVDAGDVAKQLVNFKDEIKKNDQDYETLLIKMKLTETELKVQIENQLRWEKFVSQQATDDKLKQLFDHMPEAFDGTTVSARHILIAPAADALAKTKEIKMEVEKAAVAAVAKLPPDADNLTRLKAVESAFVEAARKHSTCPSKAEGGDLGSFPRYGRMVEPFAKASFAQREFQIGDPVQTQFGYHLILVTGRKPGKPTKFEDAMVKEAVKEVYEGRLREAVLDQMKPRAKIEIAAPKN